MARTRASTKSNAMQLALLDEKSSVIAPTVRREFKRAAGASGRICIERVIVHELNNRTRKKRIADSELQLDEESEGYFVGYIRDTANHADWHAVFDDCRGEVASHCHQLLVGSPQFIQASQGLAHALYKQMVLRPNNIDPGDFAAVIYTAEDVPGRHIALLKLRPERRLGLEFQTVEGQTSVATKAAENLLPEFDRLQKCALLTLRDLHTDYDLTLFDAQAGPQSEGVAAFFYRGFLTTELVPSARRRTRLFLTTTETWMSSRLDSLSPQQVLAFYAARRSVLASDVVDLGIFAGQAIPHSVDMQASLVQALRQALFRHDDTLDRSQFVVDRATADPLVRTVTLELDGGARLKVDARLFDGLVHVTERRTGEQKFQLVLESLTLREVAGG
jgi:hypothetical protein